MDQDEFTLKDYLSYIVEAIDRIAKYTLNLDEVDFLENQLVQDAVLRNIRVIRLASLKIETNSPEFIESLPIVPWGHLNFFLNETSRFFVEVDFEATWKVIKNDLPMISEQLEDLELNAIADSRTKEKVIKVDINSL